MNNTSKQMVKWIISLHEEGYHDDFNLFRDDQLWAVQENRPYVFGEIRVNKIGQIGGGERKTTKFILAIETAYGTKGILAGISPDSIFLSEQKQNIKIRGVDFKPDR